MNESNSAEGGQSQRRVFAERGLYAIADADAIEARGLKFVECALAMCDAGLPVLQVRAKNTESATISTWLNEIVSRVGRSRPLLIQNDHASLGARCGLDGVHVGQGDTDIQSVRAEYPQLLTGLSTHNLSQLKSALTNEVPDYVAIGPVFSTVSKKNPEAAVGLKVLAEARQLCGEAHVPLVAIGGVTEENLADVARSSDLVAAIGVLLPPLGAHNPYLRVRSQCERLHQMILSVASLAERRG